MAVVPPILVLHYYSQPHPHIMHTIICMPDQLPKSLYVPMFQQLLGSVMPYKCIQFPLFPQKQWEHSVLPIFSHR